MVDPRQPLPLTRICYGIILIHGGQYHRPSQQILAYLDRQQTDNIFRVEVVDERIKQWLCYNDQNIIITEIPCFIVACAGQPTRILSVKEVKTIVNMAYQLSSTI